jgi:hypothetical protein
MTALYTTTQARSHLVTPNLSQEEFRAVVVGEAITIHLATDAGRAPGHPRPPEVQSRFDSAS